MDDIRRGATLRACSAASECAAGFDWRLACLLIGLGVQLDQ
jgi:hypothetical protein